MPTILAINAGSSSLKFQLFTMPEEQVLTKGIVERIGLETSVFTMQFGKDRYKEVVDIDDHTIAGEMLLEKLISLDVISSLDEIKGIGHRVVHGGQSAGKVLDTLNKKSGMLAVSGFSSDLRDIESEAARVNVRAELALEVFASRVHKYIGSYAARMSGLDAIIFTAGVGENSEVVRARVLQGLEFMGVYWESEFNKVRGKEAFINTPYSPVKSWR